MLNQEMAEATLDPMGDFLAQAREGSRSGDVEPRFVMTESEKEELEDVWGIFCLLEDYEKNEKELMGSKKKKKLKEEEVKEMREDREKFRGLVKKLKEREYEDLKKERFLREVKEKFEYKFKVCERRVVFEKRVMIENLFVKYIDEKRGGARKNEWVRVGAFFAKKSEELISEIEGGRESFEVKKGKEKEKEKERKKDEVSEEKKEEKEKMEEESEEEVIVEEGEEKMEEKEEEEKDYTEDEGIRWEKGVSDVEFLSEKKEEKKKEKAKWVEILDEEGKVIEREPRKKGKVKKGDWLRGEHFVRVENREENQRWKCLLCEKVLERKKVNLLEVHRHFIERHEERARLIEVEKLPGDYDCRRLWLGFFERNKIEMSEELARFLRQERKRKKNKDVIEREGKKRKIEEREVEKEKVEIGVSFLAPSHHLELPSFVKAKNLLAIQKKVQKVLSKVKINLVYFFFFLNFFLESWSFHLRGKICSPAEIVQTFSGFEEKACRCARSC